MAQNAPGKHYRDGMSLVRLMDLFPTEEAAHDWFADQRWNKTGCHCPRCGSIEAAPSKRKFTFWCSDCKQRFSVRTGTILEESRIPLRKWAIAVYLHLTSLKGVSSMKLHRDIGVTQKTAWFMLKRIRKAWESDNPPFVGPIEIDETYMGGKERNKHSKDKIKAGLGTVGKAAIVGAKDRKTNKIKAAVVKATDAKTLQGFVVATALAGATVYTDDAAAYKGMPFEHESVRHSVGEYVSGMAHTNGIESFWSMLKRAHKGVYHKISAKHLQRYLDEFSGRHGIREQDTLDQMQSVVSGMVGKRLMYRDLVAD